MTKWPAIGGHFRFQMTPVTLLFTAAPVFRVCARDLFHAKPVLLKSADADVADHDRVNRALQCDGGQTGGDTAQISRGPGDPRTDARHARRLRFPQNG